MSDFFPLVLDKQTKQIKELPEGESLTLFNSAVSSSVNPSLSDTFSIGSSQNRWAEVHATSLFGILQNSDQPNITGLGTIESGLWRAEKLELRYGGTNAENTAVPGAVIYSTGVDFRPTNQGVSGDVLISGGFGTPEWTKDLRLQSLEITDSLTPATDGDIDLGSPDKRWANVFTNDLHLKNDRGDWTVIEEEDCLTLRNNKNGKVYEILMRERCV